MQKITSLWRKEAEHLQTGLWKKKIVTTAWWTMERGWTASSMRMAPLLDNTVVRKRKNQPRETRAQRPLHLSTPWTPLFKSLGSVAMSRFSGLSFLGSSHPSQPMDLWVERMFSAVCEYYESKARTQLSHVIMWTGVQRAYLSLFRVGFSRFPWNWLKKKKQSNTIHSSHHSPCGIQLNQLHETYGTEDTPRMCWRHGQVLSDTILSRPLNMNSVVVESVPVAFSRAPMSLWALLWNSWLCLAVVSLFGRRLGTVCTVYPCYVNQLWQTHLLMLTKAPLPVFAPVAS